VLPCPDRAGGCDARGLGLRGPTPLSEIRRRALRPFPRHTRKRGRTRPQHSRLAPPVDAMLPPCTCPGPALHKAEDRSVRGHYARGQQGTNLLSRSCDPAQGRRESLSKLPVPHRGCILCWKAVFSLVARLGQAMARVPGGAGRLGLGQRVAGSPGRPKGLGGSPERGEPDRGSAAARSQRHDRKGSLLRTRPVSAPVRDVVVRAPAGGEERERVSGRAGSVTDARGHR
jgi:hypothetical protein